MGATATRCCCCCKKAVEPPKHDPVFVAHKDRKCTDVLCLVLFICFWVGMIVIAAIGFAGVRRQVYSRQWAAASLRHALPRPFSNDYYKQRYVFACTAVADVPLLRSA